jgi:phospholipid/cholesterol/gamma-HCH transport system ATP-binding protein
MAIEIKGIRKKFKDKEVLKGIDFFCETGKVNMIIGASGSGKSVLAKCVVGLLPPDEGKAIFDGLDFWKSDWRVKRDIRKNIGMLFQFSALFDSMTVAENVAFPMKMFTTWTAGEIQKRVHECLERVNLHNIERLFPAEISGGMKKRVGIARAIALNPKYLFCDEPNSGLDPQTSVVIDELIQDLTQDYQTTTVVITHDMNSVLEIGDNIMFIYKGNKEWEGSRVDILTNQNKALNDFMFSSSVMKRVLKEQS